MNQSKWGRGLTVLAESVNCALLQYVLVSAGLSFRHSPVSILFLAAFVFVDARYMEALEKVVGRRAVRYALLAVCVAAVIGVGAGWGYLDMRLVPFREG